LCDQFPKVKVVNINELKTRAFGHLRLVGEVGGKDKTRSSFSQGTFNMNTTRIQSQAF